MATLFDAAAIIEGSGGKFFSVEFTKRTTGELRKMVCRTGVRSHLKGGELGYDPVEKRLITVFDTAKNQYRSIPLEGIRRVVLDGVTVVVD